MTITDPNLSKAFAEAALTAAAKKAWRDVMLQDIAEAAGRSAADFYPATAADAVDAVEALFDRAVAAEPVNFAPDALVRDRLFDLAMRRFEAMETHRQGLLSIEIALERDPAALALQHARQVRAARWILALAGLEADAVTTAARAQGLAVILAQARTAWRKETSGDFAKTMSALDGALRRAEETFGRFAGFEDKRSPRGDAPAPG